MEDFVLILTVFDSTNLVNYRLTDWWLVRWAPGANIVNSFLLTVKTLLLLIVLRWALTCSEVYSCLSFAFLWSRMDRAVWVIVGKREHGSHTHTHTHIQPFQHITGCQQVIAFKHPNSPGSSGSLPHIDSSSCASANEIQGAFQIAYFCCVLVVHTAAALTKYMLLHAVCIQLGHTVLSWQCALMLFYPLGPSLKFWSTKKCRYKSSHLHSFIHLALCSNSHILTELRSSYTWMRCHLSMSCQMFVLSLLQGVRDTSLKWLFTCWDVWVWLCILLA